MLFARCRIYKQIKHYTEKVRQFAESKKLENEILENLASLKMDK